MLKKSIQGSRNSPQPNTSDGGGQFVSVLAIENDEDDCYLLRRMLEQDPSKHYTLETTDLLASGIERLRQKHFDIVLLDLGLDDTDGIETLKQMLAHKLPLPIIVLTGSNQSILGAQAIKEGAEDFIPKSDASASLISRSITYAIERHRLVIQLQNQALTDPLTRLPNRAAIYERLEHLILDGERGSTRFGIGLVDLDNFKRINDTLGHRAGDDLLRQVANRLQRYLRKSDMVARLGGDEFIILVTHYHNTEEFLEVLQKKQNRLKQEITLYANKKTHSIKLNASIGACEWHYPLNNQEIISLADKAMYLSKKRRKGEIKNADISHLLQQFPQSSSQDH